ncbi:hypothetical protein MRX96_020511 [Rhipicephalus microplus]
MCPAAATLSLTSWVALNLSRVPTLLKTKSATALYTSQSSHLPDYDTYPFLQLFRSEQARQLREHDRSTSATNRGGFLLRTAASKLIWLSFSSTGGRQDRSADEHRRATDFSSDLRRQVLHFIQDHQLLLYRTYSCVLWRVVLLVTLMAFHGSRDGSDTRS